MLLDQGYRAQRPWQSRTEFMVDASIQAQLMPEEQIRNMRPMARPQDPFPERTGFQREEWTIEEVLNVDRRTPSYRSWVSGYTVQRSPLTDDHWSGTHRNSMGAMW